MNHEHDNDPERELFARLEKEMNPEPRGSVTDPGEARSAWTWNDTADGSGKEAATQKKPNAVDQPEEADPNWLDRMRQAKHRPVRPDWLRSKAGFRDGATWLTGHLVHIAAFHALRCPAYAGRLIARSPLGVARTLGTLGRWASDAESVPLRRAEAEAENTREWLQLSRQRDRRVRWRGLCLALGAPAVLGLAVYLVFLAPILLQATAAVAAVFAFGLAGAPADRPLSSRAVIKPEVQKLTSDMVVRAMASIGISQITSEVNKGGDGITFPSPIVREGPGWRADIDLPLGVTVGDVVDRRARLASGLRRSVGCVWPDGDPNEHEGRLVLWVGDRDLSKTGKVRWLLGNGVRHDIFKGIPFGIDPRGRQQSVPMIQHNVLIGSLPGQGKTSTARVLACGAALDPTVELWLHENKGTGDLDDLEKVSHRFVSGLYDEDIAYAAESLKLLRQEVMRRTAALKDLPRDLCPDKRITREIADRKSLRLRPLVAVFDECQNLFSHPDYGKQAGQDAEFIIKVGRALGVILVLVTQRPDKDSLPTGISGNVSIRFCLKVAGQVENDMILGTSAYKNGTRATIFRPEIDAGNGYLAGATATPVVVRVAYLDAPATAKIAERAYTLRKAAGTLTGVALGEESAARPTYDLLADFLSVVHEERIWNERVAERLAELRPEVYGRWKGENVTSALRPYGIRARDVAGMTDGGERTTRRGTVRADVINAHAERDERRGAA